MGLSKKLEVGMLTKSVVMCSGIPVMFSADKMILITDHHLRRNSQFLPSNCFNHPFQKNFSLLILLI